MAIKDTIFLILKSDSDLLNLVPASQMGHIDVDEDTDYPRIVYKRISAPPLYQSNDQWTRWRFYMFSESKVELENISIELTSLLHRLYGTFGSQYIDYVTIIDDVEITKGETVYEKYTDFRIIYH